MFAYSRRFVCSLSSVSASGPVGIQSFGLRKISINFPSSDSGFGSCIYSQR